MMTIGYTKTDDGIAFKKEGLQNLYQRMTIEACNQKEREMLFYHVGKLDFLSDLIKLCDDPTRQPNTEAYHANTETR